jgi:hypothetical protein
MKRHLVVAITVLMLALVATAGSKEKPKPLVVDSGSFGVFMNGKRVATEKFQIEQKDQMSVASSQIIVESTGGKPTQQSELQMAANGDLVRYTWREIASKTQAVVEPNTDFLMERVTTGPETKPQEMPFLLPHSTMVLDDYFFSHREILAWRYLASGCSPDATGKVSCNLARTQYGVLVPQQRTSIQVSLEFAGREKVEIRGAERELTRLNLHAEDSDWSLWLDDANKVVRMVIAGTNTEIVRD